MTDTMTSQNIDLSSWDTLYIGSENIVVTTRTRFGGTHIKIGTIQAKLVRHLRKADIQNHEAFHIFLKWLV